MMNVCSHSAEGQNWTLVDGMGLTYRVEGANTTRCLRVIVPTLIGWLISGVMMVDVTKSWVQVAPL